MAEAPCTGCDGERSDVPVPREVVGLEFCGLDGLVGLDGRDVR